MRKMRTIELNKLNLLINFEKLFFETTKIEAEFYPEAFEEWKRINQKSNNKINFELDFVNTDDYSPEENSEIFDRNSELAEMGIINLNTLNSEQLHSLYREYEMKNSINQIDVHNFQIIPYLKILHKNRLYKNKRRKAQINLSQLSLSA